MATPKLCQILIEACETQSPIDTMTRVFWKIGTDHTPCGEETESNSRVTKPTGQGVPRSPAERPIPDVADSSLNPDLIKRKPKGLYYLASIRPLEI